MGGLDEMHGPCHPIGGTRTWVRPWPVGGCVVGAQFIIEDGDCTEIRVLLSLLHDASGDGDDAAEVDVAKGAVKESHKSKRLFWPCSNSRLASSSCREERA